MTGRTTRGRGSIEELPSGAVRVAVYTGLDPVTGRRRYLREVIPAGPDRDERAEEVRRRLVAQVEGRRQDRPSRSVNELLDRHFELADLETATRSTYRGYADRHIRPVLGAIPLAAMDVETVDGFYAELRRCRDRCADSDEAHACRPLSASTVRQIHFILRGALARAVRWGWIRSNPLVLAQPPVAPKPHPRPPTPEQAGRILERAWAEPDWGMLVWLAMVTGMRRGELCALRWVDVDLDVGVLAVGRSIGQRAAQTWEKDTKTHQHRPRVALDPDTVALLGEHRARAVARTDQLGVELGPSAFVFSLAPDFSRPLRPDTVSQRYRREAHEAGLDTTLHKLRHYSATELIGGGVDVRTVAGRLGHASGATTLRTYAAWISEADQRAAGTLGARMPARPEAHAAGPPPDWTPTSPYETVAATLLAAITAGTYPPGTRLPTFTDLAAHHGVSASTVQRAVRLLAQWGTVGVSPGHSALVIGTPRR